MELTDRLILAHQQYAQNARWKPINIEMPNQSIANACWFVCTLCFGSFVQQFDTVN